MQQPNHIFPSATEISDFQLYTKLCMKGIIEANHRRPLRQPRQPSRIGPQHTGSAFEQSAM